MSILEITLIAVLMAFIIAFVIRFVIQIAKFIYDMAPIIIPLLFIVLMLYMTGNLNIPKEMGIQNADYIGSVETQSGRGEGRK